MKKTDEVKLLEVCNTYGVFETLGVVQMFAANKSRTIRNTKRITGDKYSAQRIKQWEAIVAALWEARTAVAHIGEPY